MTSPPDEAGGLESPPVTATPRFSPVGVTWILLTVTGLTALAWPRPVAPWDTPGLSLDAAAVRAALAEDRRRAARAPRDDPAYAALRSVDEDRTRLEGLPQSAHEVDRRFREAMTRLVALVDRHADGDDEEVLDALRADAVERFDAVYRSADEDARAGVLGRFEEHLESYGAIDADARPWAPRFVLRTLYAARWNGAHGLAPTHGFRPVELQAYHGWLALEGPFATATERAAALAAFGEAGGAIPAEAPPALAVRSGALGEAVDGYLEAYRDTGNLRARNHALAVTESAASSTP